MVESRRPLVDQARSGDMFVLLVALIFMLLVVPYIETLLHDRWVLHIGLTLLMLLGVAGSRRKGILFYAGTMTAATAIGIGWTTQFIDIPWLFATNCLLQALFFITMALLILKRILLSPSVSFHSLCGAMSAYLLLGLGWAMFYWALDRVDADALHFHDRLTVEDAPNQPVHTAFSQLVYFSFVTMSTLGYGDIVPRAPLAQTIAWMQAVMGQFYLAVLVARIVAILPRRSDVSGDPSSISSQN